MIIKLSKNQFEFLICGLSEKKTIALKLKPVEKENQFIFIEIDENTADVIRDWASDELQKRGFDLNYELTPDGKLLEELIDAFYVG